MGSIGHYLKRPDASHIAQCLAAVCFAGLVLTIGARQAQADLAPVPTAALQAAPASPHRFAPYQPSSNTPDAPLTGRADVSIVSKTLELSMLAPDAFDDWDFEAR